MQFIISRSCTYIYYLFGQFLELFKLQRPVIQCGRKPETIFHQRDLSRPVAAIHCVYLRNTHVALIYHHQVVFGKEIQQTIWARTRLSPVEIPGIILYSAAMAGFANHFQVVVHPFFQTFSFRKFCFSLKKGFLLCQVFLYLKDCVFNRSLVCNKQVRRINLIFIKPFDQLPRKRVTLLYVGYFVIPK